MRCLLIHDLPCRHNLIAVSAVGGFLAAARVAKRTSGEVVLIGMPAEEGGSGKIKLIDAGAFDGFDAAMMFHPLVNGQRVHFQNGVRAHNYSTNGGHAVIIIPERAACDSAHAT